MHHFAQSPPEGAAATTIRHRVCFYETDAMGIVHHANYIHFFENARVQWLDDHDRPYRWYVEQGIHFATTHIAVHYQSPTAFDDELEITTWLDWARGASLGMAYRIAKDGETKILGTSEHAAVDLEGRIRRIPKQRRESLREIAARRP